MNLSILCFQSIHFIDNSGKNSYFLPGFAMTYPPRFPLYVKNPFRSPPSFTFPSILEYLGVLISCINIRPSVDFGVSMFGARGSGSLFSGARVCLPLRPPLFSLPRDAALSLSLHPVFLCTSIETGLMGIPAWEGEHQGKGVGQGNGGG